MHIRFGRAAIAVTVHGQTVHDADIEDFSVHILIHALGRIRHGLKEGILLPPDAAAFLGAAGMDPYLAHGRAEADGDVLDGPAEAGHGMSLEMRQHQIGIIIGKMTAHIILVNPDAVVNRDLHAPFLIQDIQLRYLQKAVVPGLLAVHGR